MSIADRIAGELSVRAHQVAAAIELLDGGATVPFIARYRKEATGGLDDGALRSLEKRLTALRNLDARRNKILEAIEQQGKLTSELRQSIVNADSITQLDDLYQPYKQKRRTKAQIAREAGLEPLANALLRNPNLSPEREAARFVNPARDVPDVAAALDGARHILIERVGEDPTLVAGLRNSLWKHGLIDSTVAKGKEQEGAKFSDYFAFSQPIAKVPSHRALALFRGRDQEILKLQVVVEEDRHFKRGEPLTCERAIARHAGIRPQGRTADGWLADTVRQCWKKKLRPQIENDLFKKLRERAEEEAIRVFGNNLRDLLLAAPAGPRVTMGLDPGLRTGVKVAVVDATGHVRATATIYPHAPHNRTEDALHELRKLSERYDVDLVSIGNGTASRETDRLVSELIKRHPELGLTRVMVSEAGASVYSASEVAARELPTMDVSLRGAVSIARRLQDPLAELVKIEPKAIGVGQYQHDVNQPELARTLDAVVEDCVNAVGVDVNTASPAILSHVAGLGPTSAENIVAHRNEHGAFRTRAALKKVKRLGAKAFEQCAGFLRIRGGANPLDASGVHPEAYAVVERILAASGRKLDELIGDGNYLATLQPADFVDATFGEPTVRDILGELEKPGRDPRPSFETATFREGVETLEDLQQGMVLQGVVTNVTTFGAFIDIGVHQDGLVHISQLADRFVEDPRQVVTTGDVVRVKVLDVDLQRRRIGLSMREA